MSFVSTRGSGRRFQHLPPLGLNHPEEKSVKEAEGVRGHIRPHKVNYLLSRHFGYSTAEPMKCVQLIHLSVCLSAWNCHGFQTASTRGVRPSVVRSSTLEEEDQIIDIEIERYESARLSKAKQLLEQFTVEQVEREKSNGKKLILDANGRNITTAAAISSAAGIEGDDSDNVVPDQFWSNGHLQGGNYVTRWARGVKVAEPLVKYDPVVAEKVLFRQPAKWILRNTQIAFPMGLWAAGVVTDYLMGRSKANRRNRAKQLLNAITGLGPVRTRL